MKPARIGAIAAVALLIGSSEMPASIRFDVECPGGGARTLPLSLVDCVSVGGALGCVATIEPQIMRDGFESGDTAAWQ